MGDCGRSAAGERGVLITGNWKMNLLRASARELAAAVVRELDTGGRVPAGVRVAVAPPYTALDVVRDAIRGSGVLLAAQDVAATAEGAYTGEVAAAMLADAGVGLVIVGHSERRHGLGDTDDVVLEKVRRACEAGLEVTLCVGETSETSAMPGARRRSLRGRCVRWFRRWTSAGRRCRWPTSRSGRSAPAAPPPRRMRAPCMPTFARR